MSKPNIILIHSDQHRFDCVGVNGHELIQTPNMDRLAGQGVNFSNAFTPAAICSPARASLLNGMWPTQHGCLSIPHTEVYRPADPKFETFSNLLNKNGYLLGYVAKYHQELPGTPIDYGFHDFIPEGQYWTWRKERGIPPYDKKEHPYFWFGDKDSHIKPEESRLAWGASETIRLIEKYHSGGKPFLVRWDPSEPHLPNMVPEPYFSMYPVEKIKPWLSFYDKLENKPYIQAQQKRTWKIDGWAWDKWAPIVSRYLGEITLMDHEIGRILDKLKELGIEKNTLVVYTTDHGDMCGGHGMIDKHFVMYEDVMHVPLIMRFPEVLPEGKQCDEFVIHEIDLATTFLDVAGIPAPETFQGKSLIDIANGKNQNPRKDVFGMYHGAQFSSWTQRMVRDHEWKYIWNACAEDELYNLKNDPAELKNLAQDPSCKNELVRLRKRLIEWMESVNDIMLNNWTRMSIEEDLKI